jgi:hypothetical protein
VVERGRHLGAYMQAQLAGDAARCAAESQRDTMAVLRETAIDFALPPP